MRRFCISDIHGQLDAFLGILEKADFKLGEDHLYVLGDMIDWGPNSIDVLKTIKKMQEDYPNTIFVTIGNHELLMISTLKKNLLAGECWVENRGRGTYHQYQKLNKTDQKEIYNWLCNLPVYYEVDNYYLSHSYIYDNTCTGDEISKSLKYIHKDAEPGVIQAVWERVDLSTIKSMIKDKILISGHTTTNHYNSEKSPLEIYFRLDLNYINIDCGAKGLQKVDGYRLGMLELDTFNTYYSEGSMKK